MPILSQIGRRSLHMRLLRGSIAALLIAGSCAILLPFLLMISGSMKSSVDVKDFDLIPAFLRNDEALYRKHIEGLFNERLSDLQSCYDLDVSTFESVKPPTSSNPDLVKLWQDFIAQPHLTAEHFAIGYIQTPVTRTGPSALRALKRELMERSNDDITAVNRELGTEFQGWNAFQVRNEEFWSRRSRPLATPWHDTVREFKQRQPEAHSYYFTANGFFKAMFLKSQYSKDIALYNQSHGTAYSSYDDVRLTRRAPQGNIREREDWEWFVRNTLNLLWIRIDPSEADAYRAYLAARYSDLAGRTFTETAPTNTLALSDWEAFITGWKDPDSGQLHQAKLDRLSLNSVEFQFQDFVRGKVPDAERDAIMPPQREWHYAAFLDERSALRREFAARNFITVIDYLMLHGRGIRNTVIFCLLSMATALLVNPMAAYALSRYKMASTYKILLFLLLTMSFPPMVTQIPAFLMLRDLNLLNTFAALVLPVMANGYSIFLLKGFFDSLPRELYESADIDGASEWLMFWHITMSLSRPILAVIALHAFTAAYSSFMFALLICQDERMWTLMVWLYQLQSRSGQAVVYASLLIAAIPTFAVFFFCQRIIMRGIVVPVEK